MLSCIWLVFWVLLLMIVFVSVVIVIGRVLRLFGLNVS